MSEYTPRDNENPEEKTDNKSYVGELVDVSIEQFRCAEQNRDYYDEEQGVPSLFAQQVVRYLLGFLQYPEAVYKWHPDALTLAS